MPAMVDKLARRLADAIKKKDQGKKTTADKSYETGWKIFIGWVKAKDECGKECREAKKKNVGGWLKAGSAAHACVKAKFRKHKLVAKILKDHVAWHKGGGLGGSIKRTFKKAGEAIASVATGGVSDIVVFFTKLPSLGKRLKKFAHDTKKSFKSLFQKFKALLRIKSAGEVGPAAGRFAKQVIKTIHDIHDKGGKLIGIPFLIRKAVGGIVGAATSGIATASLVPLALINLGMRKIMEVLLPKLILGTGKGLSALGGKFKILAPVIKGLMAVVKVVAGSGGSILGSLIKDPKAKAQFLAVLGKVADVSGKIKSGIDRALSVAAAAQSGDLAALEKALASSQGGTASEAPSRLSPQALKKMAEGLMDFAADKIWALVDKAVRKLLGKLMSLLDRVIDIPRTALVTAVGEVPFVGGVLAGLLNFGFGIAVDLLKNFLVDEVIMKLVKSIVDGVLKDMKRSVVAAITKTKGAGRAAGQIAGFMKFFADIAGDVSQAAKSAARGAQGKVGLSEIAAQVGSAVLSLSLRGIQNVELRRIITSAVGAITSKLGRGGVSLTGLLKDAFVRCATPIANLVATPIQNPQVKAVVAREISNVIRTLASNPGSLRTAMKNPSGFLTAAAQKVVEVLRAALPAAGAAADLVVRVAGEVKDLGFAALLRPKTWEAVAR